MKKLILNDVKVLRPGAGASGAMRIELLNKTVASWTKQQKIEEKTM